MDLENYKIIIIKLFHLFSSDNVPFNLFVKWLIYSFKIWLTVQVTCDYPGNEVKAVIK